MATVRDRGSIRTLGVAALCAKVALVPLVFDPGALIVFAAPKSFVAHGLGLILVGLIVTYVLAGGRRELPWTRLHSAVLAFVAVAVTSTILALDTTVALFGAHDRRLGLTTFADNAILFLAVTAFIRTPAALLALGVAMLAGLVGALTYEAIQVLGLDPLPWASGITRERPFGTMGNAGALAQYLGTIGAGALGLALGPGFGGDRKARTILLVVGMFALGGGLLTNTRALILGVGAAAVVFGIGLIFWTPARRAQLLGAIALVAVVLAGAGIGSGQIGRAIDALLVLTPSLTENRALDTGSVGARVVLYRVATDIVREHPLLGVGPDNYVVAFPTYRPPDATRALASTASQTSPHSWVLYLATSVGVLGLGVFLTMVALAAWITIRRSDAVRLAALASFLGTGLVTINDVGTEWLSWLALGFIAAGEPMPAGSAPVERVRRSSRRRAAERRSGGHAVAVLLVLGACLVVFLVQTQAWGAARAAGAARVARAQGDGPGAVQAAQRATEQDGLRAEYWNALGLGYTRIGRFDRAATAFRRATETAPYESTYASNLARAYVAVGIGQPAANELALETVRAALARDPNQPELYYTLALALFANGRSMDAVAAAEAAQARGAIRGDGLVAEKVGRAYISQGRLPEAETWLRRAIGELPGRAGFDARLALAQLLLDLGRRQEALETVNSVLSIDPRHEGALRVRAAITPP